MTDCGCSHEVLENGTILFHYCSEHGKIGETLYWDCGCIQKFYNHKLIEEVYCNGRYGECQRHN